MSVGEHTRSVDPASDCEPADTTPGTGSSRTGSSGTLSIPDAAVAQPTDVLYQFLRQCTAFLPEGHWQDFGRLGRVPPQDSTATIELLLVHFPADLIESANVGVRDQDGTLRLNSFLSDAKFLIPLKSSKTKKWFDIMTANGCLSGRTAAEAAADAFPVEALLAENDPFAGYLFLTATLEDACLLRSFRLPAAVAADLCGLAGQQLERFLKRFGLEPDNSVVEGNRCIEDSETDVTDAVEVTVRPLSLVLVGWSPSTLAIALPPQIGQLRQHLITLDRDGVGCFEEIYHWRGPTTMLKPLRQGSNAAAIRQVLSVAFSRDVEPLLETPHDLTKVYDKPRSYVHARDQLEQVRQFQGDQAVEQRAQQNCRQSYDETVGQKLRRRAQNESDPITGALIIAFADTAELLHADTLRMRPQSPKPGSFRTSREPPPEVEAENHKKQRERTADLVKLAQEILKRESRKSPLRRTPVQSTGGGSKTSSVGTTAPAKDRSGGPHAGAKIPPVNDSAAVRTVGKAK